jgi:hypothetical protein
MVTKKRKAALRESLAVGEGRAPGTRLKIPRESADFRAFPELHQSHCGAQIQATCSGDVLPVRLLEAAFDGPDLSPIRSRPRFRLRT